ncbi:MAG: hypothetical protein GY722_03750, partial [bacterium]|nr:hypothetical protein [bacterium]
MAVRLRSPHLLPGSDPARPAGLLYESPLEAWHEEVGASNRGLFSAEKLAALAVVMMVFFSQLSFAAVPAAEAAVENFYLKSEAVPQASLSSTAPVATVLANYDPARDAFPGIVIQKDGAGLGQTNPAAYQQWVAAAGSVTLDGPASLDLWAAVKDFDT